MAEEENVSSPSPDSPRVVDVHVVSDNADDEANVSQHDDEVDNGQFSSSNVEKKEREHCVMNLSIYAAESLFIVVQTGPLVL